MGSLILFLFVIYLLFCVCNFIYNRIKQFRMDRRLIRKLRDLEIQVADINPEHVEHELMDLQQQAQELFAHIDSTTGKKNIA